MKDSVKKIIIAVVAVAFVIGGVLFALNAIKGSEDTVVFDNSTAVNDTEATVPADSVEENENADETTAVPASVAPTEAKVEDEVKEVVEDEAAEINEDANNSAPTEADTTTIPDEPTTGSNESEAADEAATAIVDENNATSEVVSNEGEQPTKVTDAPVTEANESVAAEGTDAATEAAVENVTVKIENNDPLVAEVDANE